ncbi:YqzL-like protein [Bacillus oleivorans]|uniref:YqzL-like protein n=1 Tax=Bacillus oleivorans TaxID=1448271 RepID=A0A285CK40_9BACI|nr:YqzL family protein [Bacillus oleivorans]SNX67880.1 YqzL-like protein [Bacillus oleivorans]
MLEFTWKVFSETGNIDTYLLYKELEQQSFPKKEEQEHELAEIDFPMM